MTNFEKITETPEALGEFLASLSVADGPWEEAFHRIFCDGCPAENCDAENCPHNAERSNPVWWLVQAEEGEQVTRRATWVWRNGRVELGEGIIVPLENPLQVLIRVAKIENQFGEMPAGKEVGDRLETVWKAAEEVKKVHPNAKISVEVEV